MPATKKSTTRTKAQRDVTRALEIANKLDAGPNGSGDTEELVQILTDLDARTGRKDPSKRPTRTQPKIAIRKRA